MESVLKKSVVLTFSSKQEIKLIGKQAFSISNTSQDILQVLQKIAFGVNIDELISLMPIEKLEKLISLLDTKGLIRPLFTNTFKGTRFEKQVDFFSDFVDDPNAAQEKILNASVCILGCGGTGNIAVQHLVAAGIKKFILIDSDIVEVTNLNRQFCFDISDLGKPKVEVVKNYILAREASAEVYTCQIKINSFEDLYRCFESYPPVDLILCCADTPPIAINSYIAEYCIQKNIMCMFGSVGVYYGYIGPILKEKTHIKNFLQYQKEMQKQLDTNLVVISSSISYLNTLVATLITANVIELLADIKTPSSLNKTLQYQFDDSRLVTIYQW